MAFELIKDNLIVNNKNSNGCTQIVVEKDLIVPDQSPDIFDVIKVCGRISKVFSNTLNKRIDYKSKLYITVIYQAKSEEKPINSINFEFPFEDFIALDDLENDSYNKVSVKINSIDYRLINDRKLNIRAILDVCYKTSVPYNFEYIKDATGDIEVLKDKISVIKNGLTKSDTINIKNEVPIPPSKSDIYKIIHTDAVICDKEVKALDGKIMVKGIVCFSILYSGTENDNIIEIFETEVPFSGFIEMAESKEGMSVLDDFEITNISARPAQDNDNEDRVFDLECEIEAETSLLENEDIVYVKDIYSLKDDIKLSDEDINYNKFLCRNRNKNTIKQELVLPPKYPDIVSVLKVTAKSRLLGYEFTDNILNCMGEIEADIYYISNNDSKPVYLATFTFDYNESLDIKGIDENSDIEIKTETENVTFDLLSGREIELRVTVITDVYVYSKTDCSLISNAETVERPKDYFNCLSSVVIYTVQKGDSLWTIAKKYNTTVNDILSANSIEHKDEIVPGQKLMIIKKCMPEK